jgi:hypothetical protein
LGRAVKGALLGWALLLTLVVAPLSAHAQEAITIEGQLKNGTAGAEVPQGLAVTLDVFRLGESLETKEAVADAEGRFSFEGVTGGQGFGYIISAEHAGVVYRFESDYPLPQEPVELVVYEKTSSGEAIKVRVHTLVINAADSTTLLMNALELVGLENTGDRTFVPDITQAGPMDMLRFSLPSTVRDLDVQSSLRGGQLLQVDLGFAMTSPVPPGTHEIAYTYLSSYAGGKLTFSHSLPFGADTFRVLILQDLGQASGTGLQEMDNLVLGQRNYQQLEARDLKVGTKITLDFIGLPEPSVWRRWQDAVSGEEFLTWAVPGAFGMALIALLAYAILRKRGPSRATAGVPVGPGQRPVLTEAMARLDDRFQQRELEEQEYLQRRRELKDQTLGSWARLPRSEARPTSEGGPPPSDPTTEEAGRPEP